MNSEKRVEQIVTRFNALTVAQQLLFKRMITFKGYDNEYKFWVKVGHLCNILVPLFEYCLTICEKVDYSKIQDVPEVINVSFDEFSPENTYKDITPIKLSEIRKRDSEITEADFEECESKQSN